MKRALKDVILLCLLAGCSGTVAPSSPGSGGDGVGGDGTGGDGGDGMNGNGGSDSPGGSGGTTGAGGAVGTGGNPETSTVPVVKYAMLRLTNAQYANSVRDLFPGITTGALALPNENVVDRFNNAASGQTATSQLIENYQSAAEAVAAAISANFAAVVTCTPTTTAEEDTCVHAFIADFGKRAYRRPVTTDEATRTFNFYKAARATDTFQVAVISLIQVFLQSPAFLYRLESGQGQATQGMVPLTSHEVATRLSYFLSDTIPDAALVTAADANQLQDAAQVETQARRLLKDPRARPVVASFNYQWLGFVRMQNMVKDARLFPGFTPAIGQALHDSAVMFVEHAFWEENSLRALLTDSHAFANNALAPFYGATAPGSTALQMVGANAAQRTGVLTLPGLLAGLAGPVEDSPVKRGLLVLQSFLCQTPPPPPAGVNTNPPPFDATKPTTTRQRLASQHAVGSCAGCHIVMDDIGFAFENYDASGMWRTQENGLPIDASSRLAGTDVDGTFTGAVALGEKLAQSARVADCVTYQWLRYSLGLDTTQINVAAAHSIATSFTAAGGSFTELLVNVAKSTTFRSLKVSN
ncbi:MAG: DUF1592 domain-containing protein [Bacteroidota bacterium]